VESKNPKALKVGQAKKLIAILRDPKASKRDKLWAQENLSVRGLEADELKQALGTKASEQSRRKLCQNAILRLRSEKATKWLLAPNASLQGRIPFVVAAKASGYAKALRALDNDAVQFRLETTARTGKLRSGELTGKELEALAVQMVNAKTKAEKDVLKEAITMGWYGKEGPPFQTNKETKEWARKWRKHVAK
jgi:hypothetical protein